MDIELVKAFFLKHLLLPTIIIVLVLIVVFLKKKLSFIKPKVVILYTLISGLVLALPGFLGFSGNSFNPYWYIIASIIYLLLGIFNVNQLLKRFQNKDTAKWLTITFEVVITLICMVFGAWLFAYIFDWLSPFKGYAYISATSVIVYIIPLLFYYTYIEFLNIPFSIYKTWTYEKNKQAVDFEGIDFNKLMVINIELTKNVTDGNRFRIKAKTLSSGVSFGDWFHKVLDDYNYKNGTSMIELYNLNGDSYSWVFYVKKSIFHFRRYIDFDLDIAENNIKENDVIVCKRVAEFKQEI
ncbi:MULTISPECIES: TssN family type VI secretion system protein [Myroides]|uniref:Transmembrane protein n=1 Tax=Myroides profundi TaxID=480520 RepID=A0AAJ4W5I2_MYRPR|nr:TssN family type VI secretion system protein [Myroides profundi]SER25300.1 hypothetical protein SAMN04488089_111138 [Myroides profundi]